MLYGTFQESQYTFATCDDDVLLAGIAYVSFGYLSVMTITFWGPLTVRGKGSRMLIATNASGSLAGNNCSSRLNFSNVPFRAHVLLLLKLLYKSYNICESVDQGGPSLQGGVSDTEGDPEVLEVQRLEQRHQWALLEWSVRFHQLCSRHFWFL